MPPVQNQSSPALLISLSLALPVLALAEKDSEVDFNRDIRPILSENCFHCHGPDKETREAGLRLDTMAGSHEDLGGYAAVVPGKPDESELVIRIDADDDPDFLMPPPDSKRSLTNKQRDLLKRWVESGGQYEKHWAYVSPQRPEVSEEKHPIDQFIHRKLEEVGMAASDQASPNKLIRRASLDLIGLPPSPAETEAFLADWAQNQEAAWEKLLDRLLASPRFGERWARPWLDLARYADSNGFQADQLRDSWAYRDWVINALNENMPYDQFSIEQLAGDLLPNPTLDQKIATGFHRTVTCNVEAGVHPEENRYNQVVDRVNTTGTVWLASTLECAQCHDHKYDPWSMKDYYSIFAYFNNTPLEVENPSGKGVSYDFYGPKMDLPMSAEKEAQRAELLAQLNDLKQQRVPLEKASEEHRPNWEKETLAALKTQPTWEVLELASFEGSQAETCDPLEDGSLLVTGPVPQKTSYTIEVKGELEEFHAIRLETLTHDTLPAKGPARGNGDRPNSIVNEFRLLDAEGKPVDLFAATASFHQVGYTPDLAIDGDKSTKSGWAINPKFGEDHWISFRTTRPVSAKAGLTVEIDQLYGGERVIGRLRLSALKGDPAAISVPENIATILKKARKDRNGTERKELDEYYAKQNPDLQKLNQQIVRVDRQLKQVEPDSTLVMIEMEEPRMTNIVNRGVYLDKGEEVEAETPEWLLPAGEITDNRLGLAEWLTNTDNPLTARVAVNRWWAELFGNGIVSTEEDFGTQSEPPTHPELLDWLAMEFMESGWDMKHVLREILLSETYKRDSRFTEETLAQDPENKWFARGPRFRLPAETIRDNGLAVSGLLSTKMHGAPIMPYQPPGMWRQVGRNEPKWIDETDEDRFRRGIYVVWRRAAPYPSFVNFDAPDRGSCVVSRPRTNTPLQALTLMNDPAYVEMSLALADRILTESEGDFEKRINYAFQLAFAREPHSAEREHLRMVYSTRKNMSEAEANEIIGNAEAVINPEFEGPPSELAAWFYISSILLNLDESVTRS